MNSIFFDEVLLGEFKHNPVTACIFYFPIGVWLVSKTKAEKSTIPPGNIMLIAILNQIILIIEDSILFGRFKLGDEVLDFYGVDTKFCRM